MVFAKYLVTNTLFQKKKQKQCLFGLKTAICSTYNQHRNSASFRDPSSKHRKSYYVDKFGEQINNTYWEVPDDKRCLKKNDYKFAHVWKLRQNPLKYPDMAWKTWKLEVDKVQKVILVILNSTLYKVVEKPNKEK